MEFTLLGKILTIPFILIGGFILGLISFSLLFTFFLGPELGIWLSGIFGIIIIGYIVYK